MLGSSSGAICARRVEPNAVDQRVLATAQSRARAKNSASFGFEPGQPPSMKATPNCVEPLGDAQLVVAACSEMPSRCVPSRSVVS